MWEAPTTHRELVAEAEAEALTVRAVTGEQVELLTQAGPVWLAQQDRAPATTRELEVGVAVTGAGALLEATEPSVELVARVSSFSRG